jgi:hypothetical protein
MRISWFSTGAVVLALSAAVIVFSASAQAQHTSRFLDEGK